MQENNLQLDKIAKRRAQAARDLRLLGCSRSTYFRRLRKLSDEFVQNYQLSSSDEDDKNSVVITGVGRTVATEQCNSIVSGTATASCICVRCAGTTANGGVISAMSPPSHLSMKHQSGKYILINDKDKKQVICIPNKWLLNNEHYVYRDDVRENDIIDGVDFDSQYTL
ncbi:unnamed protein product, partial [Schistosoma spindalis]